MNQIHTISLQGICNKFIFAVVVTYIFTWLVKSSARTKNKIFKNFNFTSQADQ